MFQDWFPAHTSWELSTEMTMSIREIIHMGRQNSSQLKAEPIPNNLQWWALVKKKKIYLQNEVKE